MTIWSGRIATGADDVWSSDGDFYPSDTSVLSGDGTDTASYRWATTMPAGATINSAVVTMTSAGDSPTQSGDVANVAIVESVAESQATTEAEFTTLKGKLGTPVAWDITAETFLPDTVHDFPDLSASLQNLVDLPGFDGAVIVIIDDAGPTFDYIISESYESDPAKAALLTVDYSDAPAAKPWFFSKQNTH